MHWCTVTYIDLPDKCIIYEFWNMHILLELFLITRWSFVPTAISLFVLIHCWHCVRKVLSDPGDLFRCTSRRYKVKKIQLKRSHGFHMINIGQFGFFKVFLTELWVSHDINIGQFRMLQRFFPPNKEIGSEAVVLRILICIQFLSTSDSRSKFFAPVQRIKLWCLRKRRC